MGFRFAFNPSGETEAVSQVRTVNQGETNEFLVEMGGEMGETKGVGTDAVGTANAPYQATDAEGINDMATPTSKRSTPPAFQFYPKDLLSSSKVGRMSLTEIGAYTLLLCHCWLDNGLPTEVDQLARIVKVPTKQFSRMWRGPLGECFSERAGRLHNRRLDDERKKQGEFRRRQSDRAASGWQRRKNAAALPDARRSDALQSAICNLQSSSTSVKNTDVPRARATLVQKRRPDAAWEGPRVYVPQRLHGDFVQLRNHGGAERELFDWYESVSVDWSEGSRKSDSPGADMFAFWRSRYDEQWPPVGKGSQSRWGDWAAKGAK